MRRFTVTVPRAAQQVAPQFAVAGGLCTIGGAFTYSGARVEDAARHTADAVQHAVVAIVVIAGMVIVVIYLARDGRILHTDGGHATPLREPDPMTDAGHSGSDDHSGLIELPPLMSVDDREPNPTASVATCDDIYLPSSWLARLH
jgi:hypothetical protein